MCRLGAGRVAALADRRQPGIRDVFAPAVSGFGAGLALALLALAGSPRPASTTGTGRHGTPWWGVDMSQLLQAGSSNDERDAAFRLEPGGPAVDPFELMASQGVNCFRMRLWNSPCADHRQGCDRAVDSYANLTGVLAVARRARAANLTFVLDIHYSDWWADPA